VIRSTSLAAIAALPLMALSACDAPASVDAPTSLRGVDQSVVYGEDSRLDWYAHPDQTLRDLTTNAIVAMVNTRDLDDDDPNDIRISGSTLQRSLGLCDDERFLDHPTGASCSGTLIDDNLVLTAGHCISDRDCGSKAWVFDYYYADAGVLETIEEDDVYYCNRVVVSSVSSGGGWGGGGGGGADYAIVELDRPVVGREPAAYNPVQWPVEDGDAVSMVGFGSGIPAKLDDDGVVLSNNFQSEQNDFRASVDAFGGNSGSGVFDANYQVVGILVAGETDYENVGGCTRVVVLPEEGGRQGGEQVTYAYLAVSELCDEGYPSARLCNVEPLCGDGLCNGDETFEDCPGDCEAPEVIDPDWACDPSYYDAGDGCDCECGAYDPDCDDPRQQVINCLEGEFCNDAGECDSDDVIPGPGPGPEPEPNPIPDGWVCDAAFFNAGDGCDCECGAYDLDCDDASQTVYNCLPTQFCDMAGECADPEPEPETLPTPSDDADAGGVLGPDVGTPAGGVDVILRDGVAGTGCAAHGASHVPAGGVMLLLGGLLALRRRA
jgi:V8-like Glu-specific endopeptidase